MPYMFLPNETLICFNHQVSCFVLHYLLFPPTFYEYVYSLFNQNVNIMEIT